MENDNINLKQVLRDYREEFDLIQIFPCTEEENKEYAAMLASGTPLPDGVYRYEDEPMEFYRLYIPELTAEERDEYLKLKSLKMLKTIKNCVIFFTVLTIVSLVITFLLATAQ